jgi:hypothetical protein
MHFCVPCRVLLLLLLAGGLLSGPAAGLAEDEGFTPLFNGKDMTGFKTFLDPKARDADPAKTWSVVDGAIRCTGKPAGYFYTDRGFKNYILRYDWRYPAGSKPESNSGCLVHIQEPHKIWPRSVEPQGRYMDHGKLLKKVLRPMGEWNSTEVVCQPDGTLTVKVNGVLVSTGETVLKEGPIGWQSEGSEVHFRNIQIKENR